MHYKATDIFVNKPPIDLENHFEQVFTADSLEFLAKLTLHFDNRISEVLLLREKNQLEIDLNKKLPTFLSTTKHIRQSEWKISPLPESLRDRRTDIGSISPSKTKEFIMALNSGAQGVQSDLVDDGHCPSWRNTILSLYNLKQAILGSLKSNDEKEELKIVSNPSLVILRPRALNMTEKNILIQGKTLLGAIVDFGLHIFHSGLLLSETGKGPFFYLSKLENYHEAKLWNDIFSWTERELKITYGSIKAVVLIENVFAAFEMEEILYELKDHSAGLNSGIWDYTASFISKFRNFPEFILPDRSAYISIESPFIKNYVQLLISICHRRGAPATTGMSPYILTSSSDFTNISNLIRKSKYKEAILGSDGALVYDLTFVDTVQQIFKQVLSERASAMNQINIKISPVDLVEENDLLLLPKGSITWKGLELNVHIGIRFIYSWLCGKGTFYFQGRVEDSATAEISRSQVWQWLRYSCYLEDIHKSITSNVIQELLIEENKGKSKSEEQNLKEQKKKLHIAGDLFWMLISSLSFNNFMTTFLYEQQCFWEANK